MRLKSFGIDLHFFCRRDRRKTDRVMSTPRRLHYEPWQLRRKQIEGELATPHPSMEGK